MIKWAGFPRASHWLCVIPGRILLRLGSQKTFLKRLFQHPNLQTTLFPIWEGDSVLLIPICHFLRQHRALILYLKSTSLAGEWQAFGINLKEWQIKEYVLQLGGYLSRAAVRHYMLEDFNKSICVPELIPVILIEIALFHVLAEKRKHCTNDLAGWEMLSTVWPCFTFVDLCVNVRGVNPPRLPCSSNLSHDREFGFQPLN